MENSNSVSISEEMTKDEENKRIEEIVRNIIGDDNEAERLTIAMESLRKNGLETLINIECDMIRSAERRFLLYLPILSIDL